MKSLKGLPLSPFGDKAPQGRVDLAIVVFGCNQDYHG
jgi:hypothetical protein